MWAWANPLRGRTANAAKLLPVVVGVTATVGQIVLLREVMVAFNGNELFLGIVLAAWLLWTAIGSGLIGRLFRNWAHLSAAAGVGGCLCGISLLPTIFLLRSVRAHLQTIPGETLGPAPILLAALGSLSVFCTLCGCMFSLAAQLYREASAASSHRAICSTYLLEAAGSALGGVLASIFLLRFLTSFQIALFVALIQLCMAALVLCRAWRWRLAIAVGTAAMVVVLAMEAAPGWEDRTQQRIWNGFQIVDLKDSIYGRIAVLQTGELRSIYDNGSLLANVPDVAAAEEAVHYALLEHPAPRRILLIGGGMNGSIAEALKHPTVERLDYVELDPALLEVYRRDFPAESAHVFSDPRVRVHPLDARLYLRSVTDRFDVILVSAPDPDNAQLNRFYTAEFFRSTRAHLATGGLLALELHSSEESIGPELGEFLRCIDNTLQKQFPQTAVIPGETLHLFGAVQAGTLTEDPQVLMQRLAQRRVETLYVSPYFIPYRMAPDRMEQIDAVLRARVNTPVNHDFHPVAYYFGTVLWSAQFQSRYARLLMSMAHVHASALIAGTAILFLVLVLGWGIVPGRPAREAAAWSVLTTGFTLMALQILLLLAFQAVYGYVYHEMAVLIAMMMAGIALGGYFGLAAVQGSTLRKLLRIAAANQAALACSAPLLLLLIGLLARLGTLSFVVPMAFALLALVGGAGGGFQFPIASAIYQADRRQAATGTLYALDLMGGCAGALLLAGFLIPLFGFWTTAWVTALMSASSTLISLFCDCAVSERA